jgi:hypothetical protein
MRLAGVAVLVSAAAAAAPPQRPAARPAQALAQANRLLAAIRDAGSAETPLDRERVETMFVVRTGPDCSDIVSGKTHITHCRYVPVGPASQAALRFSQYLVSHIGPGPLQGGNVTWEVDPKRLCLTQRDLEQAFGATPTRARHPVFLDFFPGSRYVDSRSYDFTLPQHGANAAGHGAGYGANYVAVFELEGCVARLTLETYWPGG